MILNSVTLRNIGVGWSLSSGDVCFTRLVVLLLHGKDKLLLHTNLIKSYLFYILYYIKKTFTLK